MSKRVANTKAVTARNGRTWRVHSNKLRARKNRAAAELEESLQVKAQRFQRFQRSQARQYRERFTSKVRRLVRRLIGV